MPAKKPLSFEDVHRFLKTLFAEDLHAKRVLSLAAATVGVIEGSVRNLGLPACLSRGRWTSYPLSSPWRGG